MKKNKITSGPNTPLTKSANQFPVVGIGASAGGLDAFKKLLKAIPENSGIAYVLVQHLDPSHESLLPELLQKVTSIPVLEITDNIKILPDHIYIIPSSKMLIANDGKLELSPRITKKNERNLPIDFFFSSLAEVHQSHSIGVVLSGTASDGTLGLKAIKDHGGITFAQDEASAAYDGMPHSAAQAGVVDFILPPEKIPQKLLEITKIIAGNGGKEENIAPSDEDVFKQMLSLLRLRKGTDFTYYKQTTIRRRILRRMALNKNEEPAAYLKYLRENKQEQDVLYQDLLIPVTEFFRDKKSFDNLCETVFPHIIKNKNTPLGAGVEPIRIWVAGCSTGQEAYSIAICFKEFLDDASISYGRGQGGIVQIFATDISEPAIAKARAGMYKKSDVEGVSPQRLQEFFTKSNGDYQVKKEVRDMCVFALHNFLKDPPFGKMDFISCRNVLIYMEPYLQKRVLTTFHYALNPNGFLLLGKSETISSVPDLFAQSLQGGKSDKLFSRKDVAGKFMHVATQRTEQNLQTSIANAKTDPDKSGRTDFQKTADDLMLSKYTPAGVVVNEAMDIVHFRGNTSAYLEQSQGKPTHNLLKMAKHGLAFELRNILHKAKKEKTSVTKENIPVQVNLSAGQAGDGLHNISIEAIPLNTIEPHYLILFHETNAIGNKQSVPPRSGNKKKISTTKTKKDDKDLRIKQLEQELAQTREDMRSITEDQEAANEELQSANEELLSSSEELQSLNEELETGKEELQSTNEELTVVNQEIIALNEQVTAARDYAENIVITIRQPLLVLDKNLRIQTANKSFYKTFQVNEQETEGVLIYAIGNKQWNIPNLRTLLEKIIPEKSKVSDFEVTHTFPTIGERTMLLNASEVISQNNAEKLILLSIEDITEQKKAQGARSMLSNIVDSSHDAIISKTLGGIITSWNKGSEKIFGYSPEEAIGKHITILIPPELQKEEEMIIGKIKKGKPVLHFDTVRLVKDGRRINISLTVSPIRNSSGKITGASKIARDITERVNARQQIEESEKRYEMMVMQSPFAFAVLKGKDMVVTLANDSVKQMWGKGNEVEGKPLIEILPEIKDQVFPALLDEVYTTGIPYTTSETLARLVRNGKMEDVYFNFVYQPYREPDKSISGVVIIATEVTPEAELHKKLKESEKQFRELADSMPQIVWTARPDGYLDYYNKQWFEFTGFEEGYGDQSWIPILHPDDVQPTIDRYYHSIKTGEQYQIEYRFIDRKNPGTYKWFMGRANPVRDEKGNIIKWFGACTEIDDSKRLQEDLKLNQKHREDFIKMASHELKTPITTIKGYVQLMLITLEDKEDAKISPLLIKSSMVTIDRQVNKLTRLISEMLDLSRIEAGQLELTTELFNLNELVIETVQDIVYTNIGHTINITHDFECTINGDRDRIGQVISNLLGNAIKYSPGLGRIEVRIYRQAKNLAAVSVKDHGIGIDKEYQQKIFEPFFRAEGKSEQTYPGFGVGLYIASEIIQRHKGSIFVESEKARPDDPVGRGKGSTFTFTLPVAEEDKK